MESSLDLVSDSASSASDDSEDVHDLDEMGELDDTQKAALIKELQKQRDRLESLRDTLTNSSGGGGGSGNTDGTSSNSRISSSSSSSNNDDNNNNSSGSSNSLRFLRALREGRRHSMEVEEEEDEEGSSSSDGSRLTGNYKRIYLGLTNEDESIQMLSLDDICCTLATANEYSLSGFSPRIFIPLLLKFVKTKKHNGQMMLIAIRALTHIIDIVPSISTVAVKHDAVDVLCGTLKSIEYVDVAEQSMKCLKLIANDHPSSVLRSNGISSVLTYIDFFSINTQRQAVATAAMACKKLQAGSGQFTTFIKGSLQTLTNLMKYSDQQIVESTTTCFFRIVNAFKQDDVTLKEIVKHGLLPQLITIIANINNNPNNKNGNKNETYSSNTQSLSVKLLTVLSKHSTEIGLMLIDNDLPNVLSRVLTNQPIGSDPLQWAFNLKRKNDGEVNKEGNGQSPKLKKANSSHSSTSPTLIDGNDSMSVKRTKSSPDVFFPAMSPPSMSSSTQVYDLLSLIDTLLPTVPVELNSNHNSKNLENNASNKSKKMKLKRKKSHISKNSSTSPTPSSASASDNDNIKKKSRHDNDNKDIKSLSMMASDNNNNNNTVTMTTTTTTTKTTTTTTGNNISPRLNLSASATVHNPYAKPKKLNDITAPKNARLLLKLAQTMLPSLLNVYSSVASVSVCTLCLSILNKILFWMQSDDLNCLLEPKNQQSQLSEFFASLLSQSDLQIVLLALKMCLDTLRKARAHVSDRFLRDGIVTQIKEFSEGFGRKVSSNNNNDNNNNNHKMMMMPMSPSSRGMSPARAAAYAARYQRVTVEAIAISFLHLYFNDGDVNMKTGDLDHSDEGVQKINTFRNVSEVMQRLIDIRKSIESIMTEMMPLPRQNLMNNRSPLGNGMNNNNSNANSNMETNKKSISGSRRKTKRTKRMRVNSTSPNSNNEIASVESRYFDILVALKDIFMEDASVSTHELINSGIIDGLHNFLTNLRSFEVISASVSPANSTDSRASLEQHSLSSSFSMSSPSSPQLDTLRFKDRLCRIKTFLNVFFTNQYMKNGISSSSNIPLHFLIERLQAAIASCERFPTYLRDLSKSNSAKDMSFRYRHRGFGGHRRSHNGRGEIKVDQGLAMLGSPLRIQLIRMPGTSKNTGEEDANNNEDGSGTKKLKEEVDESDEKSKSNRKMSASEILSHRRKIKKRRNWQDEGVTILIEPMANTKALTEFLLQRLNDEDGDMDMDESEDSADRAYDRLQKMIKMQTESLQKKISSLEKKDTNEVETSSGEGSSSVDGSKNGGDDVDKKKSSNMEKKTSSKGGDNEEKDVGDSSGSSSTFTDGSSKRYHRKKSSSSSSSRHRVKKKYKQENICLYINGYKIQPGSTVIEAVAKSGGVGKGYVTEDSMVAEHSSHGITNLNMIKFCKPPTPAIWNMPHVMYYKIQEEKTILNINSKKSGSKSKDIPVSPRRARPKRKQPTPVTPDDNNFGVNVNDEMSLAMLEDDRLKALTPMSRFEHSLIHALRSELTMSNLTNYYEKDGDNYSFTNQFLSGSSFNETIHTRRNNTITSLITLMKIIHILRDAIEENDIGSIINNTNALTSKAKEKKVEKEDYQVLNVEIFYNSKLASKLLHQAQDPLSVCSNCLPIWCSALTQNYRFFFPFEIRRQYFYSSAFSPQRSLQYMVNQAEARGQNITSSQKERMTRIERVKVRVLRTGVLGATQGLFLKIKNKNTTIDVEFDGEVGTGEGPTMEFFTLVAKEFHSKKLSLWLDTNKGLGDSEYCFAPLGLYPSPFTDDLGELEADRRSKLYKTLGRFVGQALVDRRLLAISFSPLLLRSICNYRNGNANNIKKSTDELLLDLKLIDPALSNQMSKLHGVAKDYKRIQDDTSLSILEKNTMIQELNVDGAKIEQLCLDFTVPGFEDVEIMKNGNSVDVTIVNLEEYVAGVCRVMIGETLSNVVPSISEGLSGVIDISYLASFSPKELDIIISGTKALFTKTDLDNNLLYDHGYSSTSNAVILLREILADFSPEEQENFLIFVTGSPRLPYEGLAGLSPRLTVVRKAPMESAMSELGVEESSLPSASTCTNYFKLPDYKSKDVMKEKILKAINYGKDAFHLS